MHKQLMSHYSETCEKIVMAGKYYIASHRLNSLKRKWKK